MTTNDEKVTSVVFVGIVRLLEGDGEVLFANDTEDALIKEVAEWCRTHWADVSSWAPEEDLAALEEPPKDDRVCIQVYFGYVENESFTHAPVFFEKTDDTGDPSPSDPQYGGASDDQSS